MFKNTNHFFKKVFKDSVSQIDQDNYVNAITDNHQFEKLKTLYSDLEVFVFFQNDILESEIDSLQIKNKIEYYQKEGKEVPYSTHKNIEYEIAKRKKLPLEGISETKQILDLEKMFYQLEMYPIRRLKYKIGLLISEFKRQALEKESNIKVPAYKNVDQTNLNLEEIALKLVWERENVTRLTAKSFLEGTKYTSSDKLYYHFKFYRNANDRRTPPETKVKLKNKIKRFEKVIKTLDDQFRSQAEDEFKTLKTHLSKY